MAAGGGEASARQQDGGRRVQWRQRQEAQAHVDSGAREALPGGVLRHPAAPFRREDRADRREVGPQEERCARVVLQPAAETEADEVLGDGHVSALVSSSDTAAEVLRGGGSRDCVYSCVRACVRCGCVGECVRMCVGVNFLNTV